MSSTSNSILIKPLAYKSIVWFKASNTYVLVAHQTAELLLKMSQGLDLKKIKEYCKTTLKLTARQSDDILISTSRLYADLNKPTPDALAAKKDFDLPKSYTSVKLYKIGTHFFKVSFETEALAFLIHPKFAHLEIEGKAHHPHHLEVFQHNSNIFLKADKMLIGQWNLEEVHYFQGKFSMVLLEKIYNLLEEKWLGVFHASAISDGKKCVLFTGDSGNGKSTLAALLLTRGYTLFADDFVPVAATTGQVYYFPAAISIKEKAVKALLPLYPNLEEAPLYDFKNLNKKVRYLSTPQPLKNYKKQLPCKALVFVKYKEKGAHSFQKIAKEKAFEQLIPDTWLSPKTENAQQFLNWFALMPCYQLTYSDNELMYKTVDKIFTDDL
ncbi:MAG: hypothetical protein L3J45_00815 [Flavobacteriaceae bacterium]|nr:hypothetical protein [Flavobacteriaceae bacterium]